MTRKFLTALSLFLLGISSLRADVPPDLTISFRGFEESKKGTTCYDPVQPWYLYISVSNIGVLANTLPSSSTASPFTVRLNVFNTAKATGQVTSFSDFIFGNGMLAGEGYGVSIRLPVGLKHTDLGVKYAFRITVDVLGQVKESNENNNTFVWESGLPIPDANAPQAPLSFPGQMLFPTDTKAVPGDPASISIRLYNSGPVPSTKTVAYLSYKSSITSPGTHDSLEGTAQVEPIPPGEARWITLKGSKPFIQPLTVPLQMRSPFLNRRLSSGSLVTSSVIVHPKATGWFRRAPAPYAVTGLKPGSSYKVLIPFTIQVSGNGGVYYFGTPVDRGVNINPIRRPGK